MLSLLVGMFGTGIATWLGHALTIRSAQLKGAPAPVAAAVQGIENGIVVPVATGIVQQELGNLANPAAAVKLPSAQVIASSVAGAALQTVVTSLVDPVADPTGDTSNAPPAPGN